MPRPEWTDVAVAQLTTFGLKLLGAIAVWIVGCHLIALAVSLTTRAIRRPSLDFDANRAIRETFAGAGYPVPEQRVLVRSAAS